MNTNDTPPQLLLQQLIQGFQVTQCIYVAAKLGIADLLQDGPRTGVPDSMHDTVLLYGDKPVWQVWGDLLHSVETGEPSFEHVFELALFSV